MGVVLVLVVLISLVIQPPHLLTLSPEYEESSKQLQSSTLNLSWQECSYIVLMLTCRCLLNLENDLVAKQILSFVCLETANQTSSLCTHSLLIGLTFLSVIWNYFKEFG